MTDQNFWDSFDEGMQEESGGGGSGGIIGKGEVNAGFKVYVSGFGQDETFFSTASVSKEDRVTAKAKAQAFLDSHAIVDKDPKYGVEIKLFRESSFVRGEPVTWNKDRHFNKDGWTSACEKIIVPALKEAAIMPPFSGWMRVSFRPDPYNQGKLDDYLKQTGKTEKELDNFEKSANGMTDEDMEGNPRLPLVAFVVEQYENEAAAMEAVKNAATSFDAGEVGQLPTVPQGLTEAEWNGLKMGMKPMFADKTNEEIAATFGVNVEYVKRVRNENA